MEERAPTPGYAPGEDADPLLLIARANVTEKGALTYAVEQLRKVRATILGCVLNDVDFRRDSRSYRSYDKYGYYYQYYYPENEKRRERESAKKKGSVATATKS